MSVFRYSSAVQLTRLEQPETVTAAGYRKQLLTAIGDLPPLPEVLSRLLSMLNDENCSAGQIASWIEHDSVLGGSVLRSVNSVYYGLPNRISSIRQAVSLLGFGTVRNLALAFSMKQMMNRPQAGSANYYALYSQHALACAVMAQFLAHYLRSDELDSAFAAGLFHDVGELLIITSAPGAIPKIFAHWEDSDGSQEDSEEAVLNITHPELSGRILESWKLPEAIQIAARYHHALEKGPAAGEGGVSLTQIVNAADIAVCFQGLDVLRSPYHPAEPPDEVFDAIGLSYGDMDLRERFEAEFQSIRESFQF